MKDTPVRGGGRRAACSLLAAVSLCYHFFAVSKIKQNLLIAIRQSAVTGGLHCDLASQRQLSGGSSFTGRTHVPAGRRQSVHEFIYAWFVQQRSVLGDRVEAIYLLMHIYYTYLFHFRSICLSAILG